MQKNLFQQTVYEVYKNKEAAGYRIIETPTMFLVLWNEPRLLDLNVAHCQKFEKTELDFLRRRFKGLKLSIASNEQSSVRTDRLTPDGTAAAMLLETAAPLPQKKKFEIKRVETPQDTESFCKIAAEAFRMQDDVSVLARSLYPDIDNPHCLKYIGYAGNTPAGIIEIASGSEACLISWVGVIPSCRRQGLCSALLVHAINGEMQKGCHKFVLVAAPLGQKIYASFGFKTIAERYDYILDI